MSDLERSILTMMNPSEYRTEVQERVFVQRSRAVFACGLALLLTALYPFQSMAGPEHADNRVLSGWVEKIALKANGDVIKAKLDTGAKTSSINALDIQRFKRDGERWVRFKLAYKTAKGDRRTLPLERPLYRNVRIKEHEGENDRRAVVELAFCFAGQWRKAQFSLVDRSKFVYSVLLGRRFLQDHTLIDPAATFLTETHCVSAQDSNHD